MEREGETVDKPAAMQSPPGGCESECVPMGSLPSCLARSGLGLQVSTPRAENGCPFIGACMWRRGCLCLADIMCLANASSISFADARFFSEGVCSCNCFSVLSCMRMCVVFVCVWMCVCLYLNECVQCWRLFPCLSWNFYKRLQRQGNRHL